MIGHFAAAALALIWNIRFCWALAIRPAEARRYFAKSFNLALCYYGLSPKFSFTAVTGAAKAAFFCCAYDVVTDWRGFAAPALKRFENILRANVSSLDSKLALDLLGTELANQLTHDGLSRGPAALQFVSNLMGLHIKTERMGIFLQIVDDVLDVEDDFEEQQANCLFSERRDNYLQIVVDYPLVELAKSFPNGRVLMTVIRGAKTKAQNLLDHSDFALNSQPPKQFEYQPAKGIQQEKDEQVPCEIS